ncbi:hypothetical protein AB4Z54_52105, partial [Streptomyces sp. MCAF7]
MSVFMEDVAELSGRPAVQHQRVQISVARVEHVGVGLLPKALPAAPTPAPRATGRPTQTRTT